MSASRAALRERCREEGLVIEGDESSEELREALGHIRNTERAALIRRHVRLYG